MNQHIRDIENILLEFINNEIEMTGIAISENENNIKKKATQEFINNLEIVFTNCFLIY